MKILFSPIHYILDKLNSGSEFYWAYKLFEHISKNKKIQSVFITGGIRGVQDTNVLNVHIFDPRKLDLSLQNIFLFYIKTFFVSFKMYKRYNFDVIHHVLPFSIGNSFDLLAFINKKQFIIGPLQVNLTYVDTDLSQNDARGFKKSKISLSTILQDFILIFIKPLLSFLSYRTLNCANKIIVINNYTKQILLDKSIKREKIFVIPPGIDINKFHYKFYKSRSSEYTELLSVGYLLRRKGIDLIIKAVAEVIKLNYRVRLTIVGDGPQKEVLQKLVKDLNLDDNVIFEGFVEHNKIVKFYQKAHIFVSMSRSESWGQMYLEAMSCGLPVITTKNVGSNEIIKDGEFGFLVDQEDYQALAEKIMYLIDNKHLIAEFGKKARKEVEEKYDWGKVIIPKYLSLYRSLLKERTDGKS